MTSKTQLKTAVGVVAMSVLIAATTPGTPALACAPEVMFDPATGTALANPELEAALKEINTRQSLAEAR